MLGMFWGYVKINVSKIIYVLVFALLLMILLKFLQKRGQTGAKRSKDDNIYALLFSLSSSFIFVMTLFGREKGDYGFHIEPFYSYREALRVGDTEVLLQIIMNIVMYISFAFFLLCYFRKLKKWHALLIGFICSAGIELIQGYFKIGLFEVDDIINNVLGVVIGILLYKIHVKYGATVKKTIKETLKKLLAKLSKTKFAIVLSFLWQLLTWLEYALHQIKWALTGKKKPTAEETRQLCEECTIIFKSFERQKMAKCLYKNIQKYYPGIRVIIADDSSKPLELTGENLEIIQLPFNSGLSVGLNRALERVTTPFVVRMDDDQLLTPFSKIEKQIVFLKEHSEVDLVGILLYHMPICRSLRKAAEEYYKQPMNYAPKKLLIPHLTKIDATHIVVGKSSNTFVARTDKIKEIGYDDNIRMIDHNEFFFRAAGNIVSVLDKTAFVLHYRNRFDMNYEKYRRDYKGDQIYISAKMKKLLQR